MHDAGPYVADPWGPQADEVRAWAYDADADAPDQDVDLALRWARHEPAYFELASDPACPTRLTFLHVLDLTVGDAVRSGFTDAPEPLVRALIARGDGYTHPDIRVWQERSRALLAGPATVDYGLWCDGGPVRADAA